MLCVLCGVPSGVVSGSRTASRSRAHPAWPPPVSQLSTRAVSAGGAHDAVSLRYHLRDPYARSRHMAALPR